MIIKQLMIFCLKFYQRLISSGLPPVCRFYPTCSEYSVQAIDKYGIRKGFFLSMKRLLRCHPLNQGGYDPVP